MGWYNQSLCTKGANVQCWEHTVREVDTAQYSVVYELERMSADGWELVAVLAGKNVWDYTLFFKRAAK